MNTYINKIKLKRKLFLNKYYTLIQSLQTRLFVQIDILNTKKVTINYKEISLEHYLFNEFFYFKNICYKQCFIPIICLKTKQITKKIFETLLTEQKQFFNKVLGAIFPYKKYLSIEGANFRFELENKKIIIFCGFTKPIKKSIPKQIHVLLVNKNLTLCLSSSDKEKLGLFAAQIKKIKPDKKYRKGIFYGVLSQKKNETKKQKNDYKKK